MIATFFIIFAFLYRGIQRKRHTTIQQRQSIDDHHHHHHHHPQQHVNPSQYTQHPPTSSSSIDDNDDECTPLKSQYSIDDGGVGGGVGESHHPLLGRIEKSLILSVDTSNTSAIASSSATNTSSSSEKLYSRSDSTITNTSVDPYSLSKKQRGDSIASTVSTSAGSDVLLSDGTRRCSEGTRVGGPRRSSGRIRRYGTRIANVGGRRRTTGR